MRKAILALALILAASAVAALEADEMFADPALEERAREIGRQLRCVKCRNQSIFDSNAGIARDLRALVRERIAAGDTDAEVLAYAHERYGDFVLFNPPVNARTYLLWLTPAGLLLLAGAGFATYMRGRVRAAPPATLSPEDRAAAQRLLSGEET